MLGRTILRFPFTCYGVVAAGVLVALVFIRPDYNQQNLGTWLAMSSPAWAFPFWLFRAVGLPWFLGIVPCVALDLLLGRMKRSDAAAAEKK